MIAWGGNEFTPLLVMYKRDGLSAATVDLMLFEYVLGIVPAMLIGGPLSDRYGRRLLMCPAPIVAAAGSMLLACGEHVATLSAGRVLSGVALGLAMAVGGSWLKELSQPPYAVATAPGTGARRQAMSLTGGFGLGAAVAGSIAQWGPWPGTLPYLINSGLCVAAAASLLATPDTVTRDAGSGRLLDDLKIPAVGHRRFRRVVLPVAVWLFACSAGAYAILPTLMLGHAGRAPIAFSALVCVVTLGCGFGIQSVVRRLDRPGTVRLPLLALTLVVAGMLAAILAADILTVWATLLAAALLGTGYGAGLVAGLQEIERIARPDDLAGLNAVFYAVSYSGFALPFVMALVHSGTGAAYPVMFTILAAAAAACLMLVARAR
ncbi:MFS transporter [Nocardia stercoris]|uniref:MFS transporter n=1 Tax=Nocardia stercoris TaxID=2483361 RepID=UPI001F15855F|nr:MFS transporter [Nocardia stercoris]